MRLSCFVLCTALLAGCAGSRERPVATAERMPPSPRPAATGVEVRHMYLFAPGRPPVLIVIRDSDLPAQPEALAFEPPRIR